MSALTSDTKAKLKIALANQAAYDDLVDNIDTATKTDEAQTFTAAQTFSAGAVLPSAAALTVQDGGQILEPVTSCSTSATMSNYGITTVGTTAGSSATDFGIADPVAGTSKTIVCTFASASDAITILASTAVTFDAGTKNRLKFVAPGVVTMKGVSATRWALVDCSSLVAFPTSV